MTETQDLIDAGTSDCCDAPVLIGDICTKCQDHCGRMCRRCWRALEADEIECSDEEADNEY
jgi:hypothetical protein